MCGGVWTAKKRNSYRCLIHNFYRNEWRFLSNMTEEGRVAASSVELDDNLWITGGVGNSDLKTTEFIYPSGKVMKGPDLPVKTMGHCMIKLHDGKIMILGGNFRFDDDGKQVLIYDPKSNYSLLKGPPLLYGIQFASCTVFNSPMHNQRPVVLVTGGMNRYKSGKPISTSQIFDYTYRNLWEIGEYSYSIMVRKYNYFSTVPNIIYVNCLESFLYLFVVIKRVLRTFESSN